MKIRIAKNGPYIVSGNVPLREMIITPEGRHYVLKEGRRLPQAKAYALCRCGASKNAPFCDGIHQAMGFDGTETASREPFRKRLVETIEGTQVDLLDDGRCALARFCHTDKGMIWDIMKEDKDDKTREMIIEAANACPAGRLEVVDKDGVLLEKTSTPEIIILQDPQKKTSSAIFVKGPITVVAADGTEYEVRNRVTLCRCGNSSDKPFCDCTHIHTGYNDGYLSDYD